jgi:CBS domain containing-hemolysin-like protein
VEKHLLYLILVIIVLLAISFLCSILESVILSLTRPYIQHLLEKKSSTGKLLKKLKDDIDEPITAILTLNTISHTIGATISGAIALQLFGSRWMALFSAVLTLLILLFSEIIPKTLGAYYWKSLSPVSAYILRFLIVLLKPVVMPVNYISKLISRGSHSNGISKGELVNFIKLGYLQGVIKPESYRIVNNIVNMERMQIKEIMTPRTVVFWLPHDSTVHDIKKNKIELVSSRIPLYNRHDNRISGIVHRRDVMRLFNEKRSSKSLASLSYTPLFVIETLSVFELLRIMISEKKQIGVVLDEYGDYVGIVSIEDVVETLLAVEIIDEYDKIEDPGKTAGLKKKSSSGEKNDDEWKENQ